MSLKIVFENDPVVLARVRALEELSWPLRDLSANLFRVARGAGKPYAIGQQMAVTLEAFRSFRRHMRIIPVE